MRRRSLLIAPSALDDIARSLAESGTGAGTAHAVWMAIVDDVSSPLPWRLIGRVGRPAEGLTPAELAHRDQSREILRTRFAVAGLDVDDETTLFVILATFMAVWVTAECAHEAGLFSRDEYTGVAKILSAIGDSLGAALPADVWT